MEGYPNINDTTGNILWHDAVKEEVSALISYQYFDFKSPNFKSSSKH